VIPGIKEIRRAASFRGRAESNYSGHPVNPVTRFRIPRKSSRERPACSLIAFASQQRLINRGRRLPISVFARNTYYALSLTSFEVKLRRLPPAGDLCPRRLTKFLFAAGVVKMIYTQPPDLAGFRFDVETPAAFDDAFVAIVCEIRIFFFRILWIPTVLWTSCSYQEPFFWCSLEISQILSNVRIKRIRSDQLFNLYFGKISQIANWSSFHEYLAGNIPLFNEMNFKRRLRFPRERLAPKWKLLIRRVSCM